MNNFCEFTTTRRKYQKERFTIDIDEIEEADFRVCEIESMVKSESEIDGAREKISRFAARFDLTPLEIRGKMAHVLEVKYPKMASCFNC